MAYVASLFLGLFTVWTLAAFGGGWPPAIMLGLGAVCVVVAVFLAVRMGAAEPGGAWTRAPATLVQALARTPGALLAALGVVASAIGIRPSRAGFVRLKWQSGDEMRLAEVIEAIGARPGLVVVDADAGSALVHAFHEDGVNIDALRAVERQAHGSEAAS